jgi:hypothetical protein
MNIHTMEIIISLQDCIFASDMFHVSQHPGDSMGRTSGLLETAAGCISIVLPGEATVTVLTPTLPDQTLK